MAATALVFAGLAVPVLGWSAPETPLGRLEPGLWELRDLGNSGVLRASICVGDRALLTQPQHGSAACTRVVIAADERSATFHYTCPAAGFGRTTVRPETSRLARIDTQGLHHGAPFGFRVEARRVRGCGGGAEAAARRR